jgi:hypothetical protein
MRGAQLHLFASLLAFAVPCIPRTSDGRASGPPQWPTQFEGSPLRRLPLLPEEEALSPRFPGRIAKFTDGERHIVISYIERDTRLVHHPEVCMKALGYAVHPRAPVRDGAGRLWGAFDASRGGQRLRVRHRISEVAGEQGFTDVSSWYWSALLSRSRGPWWSVLVAEAATPL